MNNELSPVVLFTYNRLWHTKQTIEALKNNYLASETILFIFSDAAKDKNNSDAVNNIRKYLYTIKGFKKIEIIARKKNYGLANSIIDGVTSVVSKYGRVIVLEDDLVTSPMFLNFMNEALEIYKKNDQVMHVSGSIYPINNRNLDETFFIKPASCWGWGTWDNAWKYYKKDSNYYLKVFDRQMINDFNLNNSYKYFDQIKLNHKGKINTWAIFWYASIYLNNGLSLHPKESFVKNIGHDGLGENCDDNSYYDVEISSKMPSNFSQEFTESKEAKLRFEDFFNSIQEPLYKRIINKISREIFGGNFLKLKGK
jgi:hypothetical protein